MDNSAVSTTMKARRVNYDDYSGTFNIETRLESLRRQVLSHAKLVSVLNRSQDAKLQFTCKKHQEATGIECRKLEKEGHIYRQSLRHTLAYADILRDFASKESHSDDVTYSGLYDLGLSRKDLCEMINEKVKDSTPSAKRQKLCRHILNNRKRLHVFDRTKSTSALLRLRDTIISRPTSDQSVSLNKPEPPYSPRIRAAKLILPPITVSVNMNRTRKVGIGGGQTDFRSDSFFLTDNPISSVHNANKLPAIDQ